MKVTTFGLDLAKRVFQLHWVDVETGEVGRRRLRREQVLPFFANRVPAVVAMEACGSAHYWGRQLRALGHEVKLIAAQFVRPFVQTNKTDAADAQAIWEAAQRPKMRFVALKDEGQQSVLALHRMREQLVKLRTMQSNQVRGLLYEFGVVLPVGRERALRVLPEELEQLASRLPAMLLTTLRRQQARLAELTQDIVAIELQLKGWAKTNAASQRLQDIPGVGLLTATAAVATVGEAKSFRSGREFAACLGIVPRQSGTGGRVKLLGISKRGDVYLRTLLIHGARAVINRRQEPDPWLQKLLARRPPNVAAVALANKMARMIWALLAHDRTYDKDHVSTPPGTGQPAPQGH
jgi:transposase